MQVCVSIDSVNLSLPSTHDHKQNIIHINDIFPQIIAKSIYAFDFGELSKKQNLIKCISKIKQKRENYFSKFFNIHLVRLIFEKY